MIPKLDQTPPIPNSPEASSQYNNSRNHGPSGSNNNNDREDARISRSSVSKERAYDSLRKKSSPEASRSEKLRSSETKKGNSRNSSSSSSSDSNSFSKPKAARRNSNESCSSINSMEEFPSSELIPSAQEALHTEDSSDVNSNSAASHLISPSTTTLPRITSKGVSFNKRVRIRKIKRLEDMTQEEIEATYFTDDELIEIRNDLRANIRALIEKNYREDQHETVEDYWSSDDESEKKSSPPDIDDTNKNALATSSPASFCVRGLEHEFPQGKFRRKQLKMMSRGAVLEEQRLQREFRVGRHIKSLSSHSTSTTSTYDSSIHSFVTSSTMNSTAQPVGESSTGSGGVIINEDAEVAISEIYRIESKPAVQLALEFAKRDEAIADQIYFAHQAV